MILCCAFPREISKLQVINYDSALSTFTILEIKSVILWVFFLIYPGAGHETFSLVELTGFSMIVFGSFIYCDFIFKQVEWLHPERFLNKDVILGS
mmetsp:Transcript_45381/g.33171  ORF Transcript_45381/g.33171 Transcript_45381/m.33171 type:complete len:95 (+) Transcript_45381:235-519(+)